MLMPAGGASSSRPQNGASMATATIRSAESNDGIWLRFMGGRWVSAGPAVPLRAAEFVVVGEYAGFPVFARTGLQEERIYIATRGGLLAPFTLKATDRAEPPSRSEDSRH